MNEKKAAVITGGAGGIGKELVKAYAEKGYDVLFADILHEQGGQLQKELSASGLQVRFVHADISDEEDVKRLMDEAVKDGRSLSVLINNAGKSAWKSPYDLTADEWDDVLNTNLKSVFLCSREAAKKMRGNENGGAIVNMASTRAFMSEPNSEAYAASKGGIIALTHALAASLSKDSIVVNSIAPGWIETEHYEDLRKKDHEQHFSNRVGRPLDIVKACFFLTDPDNRFVTGTNITVDGGMTKKMMYEE
ncbi:SDR family oxidoreductase [Bacillus sonorensis]|uniref:Oxidoreductase n=2 Tax=Bacillus sonorensis TaxID=119858 RepID=M5PFI0_9BACI|nr:MULTISPECIES: SDR family oxidoreductase [Bacillus]TWK82418.1 3-oxoacyl-[acyl-carrier-protein] reductase FabG [Bacillus paralicheniformis]ASB88840.1 2,3-dihydro-2,3-dihydroxybenzoate dehydrogenase [Bacillus sonorensis]EME76350.1 oxidoreductase [Bacillus sonorensis L12]MBG9915365.1 3-ketoacyl-ACP reductase [Bacillus sonorensis]MCF7618195.1 SDR family oxidoreductase [Bacillus sonorensis]